MKTLPIDIVALTSKEIEAIKYHARIGIPRSGKGMRGMRDRLQRVYRKTGLHSRIELIYLASSLHLI